MTKKNTHPEMEWPHVWDRCRVTFERTGASKEVLESCRKETRHEIKNNVLYLHVERMVKDYIEQNMDDFKPILWPFIKYSKCSKLIYKIIKHANNHGTNQL